MFGVQRNGVLQAARASAAVYPRSGPVMYEVVGVEHPSEPVVGKPIRHLLGKTNGDVEALRDAGAGLDQQPLAVGQLRAMHPRRIERGCCRPPLPARRSRTRDASRRARRSSRS